MPQKLLLTAVLLLFVGLLVHRAGRFSRSAHEHDGYSGAGTIASLGDDEYHLELIGSDSGKLTLYTLAREPSEVLEVERQVLEAHVSAPDDPRPRVIQLRSEPQAGDAPGLTSRFSGDLPSELAAATLRVSIPNLRIDGRRFHATFSLSHAEPTQMPAALSDAAAEQLHFVSAGKYTRQDIEANGRTTPAAKYRDFQARHNFEPAPGDRLCPISRTQANPACRWTVAGQEYEFCCPPCIDEFVRLAKERPEQILPPDNYIK